MVETNTEVTVIELLSSGTVVFSNSGNDVWYQTFKEIDILDIVVNYRIRIIDKDKDRAIIFPINLIAEINIKGVKEFYTPLAPNPDDDLVGYQERYMDIVRKLALQVFRGCCPAGGGGDCPTLGELIATATWADIQVLLSVEQEAAAVAALCESCQTLAELIAAASWATIEADLSPAQTADAIASLCEACPVIDSIQKFPIYATQKTSYDNGDEGWRWAAGDFEEPTGPYLAVQQLDRSAVTPYVTLKHSLPVVGVNRFTNTSDATLAYGDATPANGIVKDWLTRKMWAVNRQSFVTAAPLDAYQVGLASIQASAFEGFTWRCPTKDELDSLFDMNNTTLLSAIGGPPPGFNITSLLGISACTTNPNATTQCYRTFTNGQRQGTFAVKSASPCFMIMVRDF